MSRALARHGVELVIAGVLAGVAFGAAGGSELSRTSVVEVLVVLAGGALVAAAIAWGGDGPQQGALTVALFAALAALTALSITWAQVPSLAYVEAGRTLAYLAIFAGAVAGARLAPRATPAVITGIVLAATAAVLYALAARIWPASIGENEISNRIGQPFEYWNAVGSTAALAIPGLLWLATRRGAALAGRVLAYPALGAAVLALLLTQSRGALAAATVGVLLWLIIVPVRMRALPAIALPCAVVAPVAIWALSKDGFSTAAEPLAVKQSIAGEFGLLVLLMLVVLTVAGALVNLGLRRGVPPLHVRRRIGIVALALACAAPLVAFTSVAFSDRGIGGTIGDRVDQLTSESQTSPNTQGAGRLTQASSTRGKYWREAGHVFSDRPWIGFGAGNFQTTRLRYRTDDSATRHAHGFIPQTMADLGILGLLISAALLLAWLVGAARATGLHPRRNGVRRDWDADRLGLVALALTAIVFGLQSAIDWTWFVPGPTAMALVGAGFVAGRPPLGQPVEVALGPAVPAPPRLLAAAAVLLVAVVTAWAVWQPEASDRQMGDALALSDAGHLDAAIAKTEDAADTNPLSSDPLLTRAAIQTQADQIAAAQHTLERAVLEFPGDPQTWFRLASFQLGTLDHPLQAAATIRAAIFLDPQSLPNQSLFLLARARARELAARAQK